MNKRNIILAVIVVLAIVILIYFKGASTEDQPIGNAASSSQKAVRVGDTIPNFNLLEVNNIKVIPKIFIGDPAIIWFTTSWCVPCQIGAREVAKLDTELGDEALDVLVVFLDPNEMDEDLINWRDSYANPDWLVAFDSVQDSLAKKLDVQFLDTKYLVDENGVIMNIDVRQVNSAYLDLIRQAVAR